MEKCVFCNTENDFQGGGILLQATTYHSFEKEFKFYFCFQNVLKHLFIIKPATGVKIYQHLFIINDRCLCSLLQGQSKSASQAAPSPKA